MKDTGIGVTQDNLRKLFKNFNQAEASTASLYGGTGLGLALSQGLCRMMGGEITVESEYGRGSCFTICIPAYIDAQHGPSITENAGLTGAAGIELRSNAA